MELHRDGLSDELKALVRALGAIDRPYLVGVVVLSALAVCLRLQFLDKPVRYDEAFTYVFYVQRPWHEIPVLYTLPNNHILFTALAKASTLMFGSELWALRLPALAAGAALIPATFLAGWAVYGPAAGLAAGALVVASSPLVLYSTNARGYSLVVLMFVLLLAVAGLLQQRSTLSRWGLFCGLAAIGFFAIPVMLYPFGAICVWILTGIDGLNRNAGRQIRALAVACLIVMIVVAAWYTPAALALGPGAVLGNPYVVRTSAADFVGDLAELLNGLQRMWSAGWPTYLAWLTGAAAGLAIPFHRRFAATGVSPLAASLFWTIGLMLLHFRAPYARVLPLVLLSAAATTQAGICRVAGRMRHGAWLVTLGWIAVACWLSAALLRSEVGPESREGGALRDAPMMARLLGPQISQGARVIALVPSDVSLQYWLLRYGYDPLAVKSTAGPTAGGTTFLVINVADGQNPWDVVSDAYGPDSRQHTSLELWRQLPESAVYRVVSASR